MSEPFPAPADLPIGTVITNGGLIAQKTGPSDRDPWPWTCDAVVYSDEWAATVITNGAHVTLPPPRRPRRIWHLFNALTLVNLVLMFTADDTASRVLHAVAVVAFAVATLATRPPRPDWRS
ncbi:hypothetical protein AB0C15_06010 [Micromonospora sp. NPDC048835]|uniref:hypothetical protein n=1 Tax=Micromonospora sp. NPDC048835 TaxID=3155147 RepID=UPI0033D72243